MSGTCTSCGAAIIWLKTEKGKRIPVDAEAKKVVVRTDEDGTHNPSTGEIARVVSAHVAHFATCPNASKHRGNRRD